MSFRSIAFVGLVAASVIGTATTGVAQETTLKDFGIAGGIGIFVPSSSEIRNLVGTSFVRFSVSPRNMAAVSKSTRFSFDFDIISANRNGNRFLLIPVTGGVIQSFGGDETGFVQPYGAIRAGLAYMDYSINRPFFSTSGPPGNYSARTVGFTGNAELGIMIGGRARVSGRYDVFTSSKGFSFNGLSFEASYVLFRL